jgi:ComF family protein
MHQKLRNNWINFIQHIFPRHCLLCAAPVADGSPLCAGCYRDLPHNQRCCRRCALPLAEEQDLCGHCLRQSAGNQTYAALAYRGWATHLIQGLKFRQQLDYAPLLAGLPGVYLRQRQAPMPECILPVPLHARRLRQHGYNQAGLIARLLARDLGLAIDLDHMQRSRHTPPQSGLSRAQRAQNLHDAFALTAPLPYRHLALVDDVMTTGQTLQACSRVLRQANESQRIDIWVLARTPV